MTSAMTRMPLRAFENAAVKLEDKAFKKFIKYIKNPSKSRLTHLKKFLDDIYAKQSKK